MQYELLSVMARAPAIVFGVFVCVFYMALVLAVCAMIIGNRVTNASQMCRTGAP